MNDIKEIAAQTHKARFDLDKAERTHKMPDGRNMHFSGLPCVNSPLECVAMLKRLNEAITTLYQLSDDQYYIKNIWNASTVLDGRLAEQGFNEDWFMSVAKKLELLRALLYGDNADWDIVYNNLYNDLLAHEAYWSNFYEERVRDLERENRKLKEEKHNK